MTPKFNQAVDTQAQKLCHYCGKAMDKLHDCYLVKKPKITFVRILR